MLQEIFPAVRATIILSTFMGLLFPLGITMVAQAIFPEASNGSLIFQNGTLIGSRLLSQGFSKAEYFHPRASAAGSGYGGEASGGTNLGPTSRKLFCGNESFKGVRQLANEFRVINDLPNEIRVPVDAVTRSASGLDPHITQANALLQLKRVARARKIDEDSVRSALLKQTEDRDLGIFGEPRVNVLKLNLALDRLSFEHRAHH